MYSSFFVRRRVIARVTVERAYFSCFSMKRKFSNSPEASLYKKPKMETASITLTDRENQLRDLLLDVARYIDESKEIKESIELRFAGGWVRDRLLNIPSHDIDTAINAMTGSAFSQKMTEYLKEDANLKKHSLEAKDVKSLHTILANPEKSKHLETVTTKIFGFDVDFVNLRKETYTEDSRNPQMEFGTAVEDAERRDATINALFYNLHTDKVEDFVGGLEDLRKKRIRTPMKPETTFKDDPLRVLRLIRFASRLDFTIDPDSENWMSNEAVKEDLKRKISRERVGVELEKMLKGNNPCSSLEYLNILGLYSIIFTDPDPKARDIPVPTTTNWRIVYEFLNTLKSNETPGSIYQTFVRSDDAKYISWVLAALVPWSAIPNPQAPQGAKIPPTFGKRVAQNGIAANGQICRAVNDSFKNFQQITDLKNDILENVAYTNERDTVGMKIRKWQFDGGKEKGNWRIQALFALLVEVMNRRVPNALLSEWQKFIEHLEEMDILDAPNEKPLVDGDILKKELNVVKGGPWMSPALDICMAWQLRNPGVKDPTKVLEGVIDEVKRIYKELQTPSKK